MTNSYLDLAKQQLDRSPDDPAFGYIVPDDVKLSYEYLRAAWQRDWDMITITTEAPVTGGGTLDPADPDLTIGVDVGTTPGTVAAGDDPRFFDSREPTPHASTHATGGTDALAPSDIGAIAASSVAANSLITADTDGTPLARVIAASRLVGRKVSGGVGELTAAEVKAILAYAPGDIGALPLNLIDAKGDLLVGSANDTAVRLPVGVAGTNPILVPDTTAAGGLAWKSMAAADVAQASQVGNLLMGTDADFNSGVGTWATQNSTVAQSTTSPYSGTGCLTMTATATVSAGALSPRVAVTPGRAYTASVMCKSGVGSRAVQAQLVFYTAADAWAAGNPRAMGALASWSLATVTAVAPVDAAYARLVVYGTGTGAIGDTVFIDQAGIWAGTGGEWAVGGTPISGQQPQLSLASSSVTTTLNAAQPVARFTATANAMLPSAVDNAGVKFTVVNDSTGTVTVNRTVSPDLIAGATSQTIPGKGFMQVISTGSAWVVLSGEYDVDTVGLASYVWRNSGTPGWRLIAYDSGWRGVSVNIDPASGITGTVQVRREMGSVKFRFVSLSTGAITNPYRVLLFSTGSELPTGFRANTVYYYTVPYDSTNGALVRNFATTANGNIQVGGPTHALGFNGELSWDTVNALPTALPGTQVTAPV